MQLTQVFLIFLIIVQDYWNSFREQSDVCPKFDF